VREEEDNNNNNNFVEERNSSYSRDAGLAVSFKYGNNLIK
jgi:hypothetical protein